MEFQWDDYRKEYESALSNWGHDFITQRYATEDILQDIQYYQNHSEYLLGENFFCKVISKRQVLAVGIFLVHDQTLTINPLIVAPEARNHGYGTAIIYELVKETRKIFGNEYQQIIAGIDLSNHPSIRLFQKVGFQLEKIHDDGDFGYYVYKGERNVRQNRTLC